MPKKILNIHDRFTKTLLSNKEMAIAFIEAYLPKEINEIIDAQSLEYVDTSYISNEMKTAFSDLVMSVSLKNGTKIKLCFLLEHKSYIDPQAAFQILEYIGLAYQNQRKKKDEIELIVPILYYNGLDKWEYQPLHKLFSHYPESVQKYIPNFHTEFIDLRAIGLNNIEELRNDLFKSALIAQYYYFDFEGINRHLEDVIKNLAPHLDLNLVDTIFVYLMQNKYLQKEILLESLKTLPENLNEKVMSIYDELIQEGIKKGKAEGIEVGKAEGKAEGIEEGIEKGIEKTVLNAFNNNIDLETIRLITGESLEKINDLLKKNGKI